MGGLSKRAYLINQLKNTNEITLLIDSGNLLFKSYDSQKLLDQDILSATTILEIYKTIGYDALAVGPYDLAAGIDLLLASAQSGTPWVSANLRTSGGSPVFAPWIIRQTPAGKVGILGLTGTASLPEGYTFAKWQDILPAFLDMLYPACDFIILISNLDSETNEEIAKRYPQIHLIISSDLKKGNVPPTLLRNTLLTQTHSRGKYLGILKIDWPGSGIWRAAPEEASGVRTELLDGINRQLTASTEASPLTDKALLARIQAKKTALQDTSAGEKGSQTGTWAFQFRELRDHISEDGAINKKIAELKQQIVERNRKIQQGGLESPHGSTSETHSKKDQVFAGPTSCRACHEQQYSRWLRTAHANSLQSLRNERQQYNIRCLACHVTREPSVVADETINGNLLDMPNELQAVSCEACHGSGRVHGLQQGEVALKPVTEATCRACHTREMDDDFQYQEKIEKLGCLN